MTAAKPLKDIELIDCARANATQGLETAAKLCGYGSDIETFQQALKDAFDAKGIKADDLTDLIAERPTIKPRIGIEVAPDSEADL